MARPEDKESMGKFHPPCYISHLKCVKYLTIFLASCRDSEKTPSLFQSHISRTDEAFHLLNCSEHK